MPRPTEYTKDLIIENALEFIRIYGSGKFSIRKLAKMLNCSTMPIYSELGSKKELKKEIINQSQQLLRKTIEEISHESIAIKLGVGYVQFAQNEMELCREMFFGYQISRTYRKKIIEQRLDYVYKLALRDPILNNLPKERQIAMINKIRTFALGMITQIIFEKHEFYTVSELISIFSDLINFK